MKLTISLTPTEEANIRGWKNYYDANPQFIGKPNTPGVAPADGQMKIWLESQTRDRFDEIAAQLGGATPALPFEKGPEFVLGGPFVEHQMKAGFPIVAFPVKIPAGPYPATRIGTFSAAGSGGFGNFRIAFSQTAGDISTAGGFGSSATVDPEFPADYAGGQWYANVYSDPSLPSPKVRFSGTGPH